MVCRISLNCSLQALPAEVLRLGISDLRLAANQLPKSSGMFCVLRQLVRPDGELRAPRRLVEVLGWPIPAPPLIAGGLVLWRLAALPSS